MTTLSKLQLLSGVFPLALAACSVADTTCLTELRALCGDAERDAGAVLGPSLQIGGGQAAFEPIAEDQGVPLIAGFQGAHHIWISLGLKGFPDGELKMHLSTRWVTAADSVREVMGRISPHESVDDAAFDSVVLGWPALLYQAQCSDQQRVEVAVQAWNEATQARAEDQVVVRIDVPPQERRDSCTD